MIPGGFPERLRDHVKDRAEAGRVLLTHAHFDHILGLKGWRLLYPDIPIYAAKAEEAMLLDADMNMTSQYAAEGVSIPADHYLSDNEEFSLIGEKIRFLLTPGHSAGSGCFYFPDEDALFSGDTLFAGSVGRWDFATGDLGALMDSLRNKLVKLPDATVVYPGHGDATSIGEEKKFNPYVRQDPS